MLSAQIRAIFGKTVLIKIMVKQEDRSLFVLCFNFLALFGAIYEMGLFLPRVAHNHDVGIATVGLIIR